jgi:phosphocarrier protein FPr
VVGLVLVSHSAKLVEGTAELAAQMAGPEARIAVAGGLDQPGRPLGTDATLVERAIEQVWSEDGVLVLMDLGSAVLSAELALELLPEDRRGRVLLTEAPLVEGAVAAAVAAGLGEPLEKVAGEARGGLAAKVAHLAPATCPPGAETEPLRDPPVQAPPAAGRPARAAPQVGLRLAITSRFGLHARPAAALVRTAAAFDADVTVESPNGGRGPVSARSLNAVATLGVRHGEEIVVRASGPQADEALAAIRRLADDGFGDSEEAGEPPAPDLAAAVAPVAPGPSAAAAAPPAPGQILRGLPASPGVAVGAARFLQAAPVALPDGPAEDPDTEWAALRRALAAAAADIRRAWSAVAGRAGEREAAIFDAHLLFLEDEALVEPARTCIYDDGENAARSWAAAVAGAAAAWDALADPYQRARVADLRAVGDQVLRHLQGAPPGGVTAGPGIVVAAELTPAETAGLDRSLVGGIACARGGPTSHAAILARSLGIPAVVGAGDALLGVAEGTTLAIDGEAGTVTVDPPAAALHAAEDRRAALVRLEAEAGVMAGEPAVTSDGVGVQVAANIAGAHDVPAARAAGADGVGLLRTELLFLEADHLPGEDEHERAYRDVAESLGGRPLTVRTLDIGADKQLAFLPLCAEQNPFLGVRGIRLGLSRPELLRTQLRAILRVAADHPLRIMFPMVTTVDEVRHARELLDEAGASSAEAAAGRSRVEVGIMVEVPAAALTIEAFLPHVDFFSLGTNDLAQYVLAAERGNAAVAGLADPLHPAVLQLIGRTARAAAAGGRIAAVCGELAGDPAAIPLLLGLGIRELSMAPARIPLAKQAVRATDVGAAGRLARRALRAASAADVRRLLSAAARA